MKDLTVGKPSKMIVQFAIPLFIGNVFQLAYNLADTRIVGSCLGNSALAAVGATSTLSDLIVGFLMGITNGFSVVTSRYFGMGEMEEVRKRFARSLLLGLEVSILLTILSLLFLNQIFHVLNVSDTEWTQGMQYISVILGGMTFSMLYNVFSSTLRAIGDTITPLIFLILSSFLNVGLDLLFLQGFFWGVGGAAVATIVSQAISAILCFAYLWKKYAFLHIQIKDFSMKDSSNKELISCGISMGLMNSLVQFGTLALQTAINTLSTNTIVAHMAARKLTNLYMTPFSVLGMTMATYTGQNYGAGKKDRIKKGLIFTLGVSYVWVLVVQIATYTICPWLVRMITDTKIDEVIDTACRYLKVDTIFYVMVPTISIIRNSLQALGKQVVCIVSSFLELVGKTVIALVFTPILGYWAIIISEPIVWVIMVIPLIFGIVRGLKNMK